MELRPYFMKNNFGVINFKPSFIQDSGYEKITQKLKVLVVDDDQILLRIHMENFCSQHYEVSGVSSGEAAIKNFKNYDILLLDIGLPDMTGIEVCKAIRKKERGKHRIIIGASAYGDDVKDSCLAAGFDVFLSKPVNHQKIEDYLDSLKDK